MGFLSAGYLGGARSLLRFLPEVANAAALPTEDNSPGDGRFTVDDQHLHMWNGTTWEDRGPLVLVDPMTCYAITGYTAQAPSGETVESTSYTDEAAFHAAITPTYRGERALLLGHPTLATVTEYESRWDGSGFYWEAI